MAATVILASRRWGRELVVPTIGLLIVVVITLIQYTRFGTDRYLGWDSSNYVYLTKLIDQFGFPTMYERFHFYPHLYVLSLWLSGKVVGGADVAERFLPLVWLFVLFVAYQRMALALGHDRRLATAVVLIAAITINTIRLYSDLHRALMALALSFWALLLLSKRSSGLLRMNRSNLALLALLVAVLATEFEQYAVLATTIVLSALSTRKVRDVAEAVAFCAIPVLLLSPVLVGLILEYGQGAAAIPRSELGLDIYLALVFGTGSIAALPFAALGLVYLARRARDGNRLARLLACWVVTLVAATLALLVGFVGIPAVRTLYLLPIPILLVSSLPEINRIIARRRSRTTSETEPVLE